MLQLVTHDDGQERSQTTENAASFEKQKTQVEDALLARDQARALEIQSRRELARVLEARKVRQLTAYRRKGGGREAILTSVVFFARCFVSHLAGSG